ncbi:hypothetical protein ACH5RR_007266 [Cinchona calisaya]|uniref:Uncharacterized protein n=1 Tax=Cinchona calisaya TaxID=153742 RepID=A0ABD3ARB9_9GENT
MVAENFMGEVVAGRNILEKEYILGNKYPMTEDISTQSSNDFSANLQSKPPVIAALCSSALKQPEGDQSEANTSKLATFSALEKQERAAKMQQCLTSTLGCQNLAAAPYPSLAISTRRKSIAAALDLKINAAATWDPSVGNFAAISHAFDVATAQEDVVDVVAAHELDVEAAMLHVCTIGTAQEEEFAATSASMVARLDLQNISLLSPLMLKSWEKLRNKPLDCVRRHKATLLCNQLNPLLTIIP